MLGPLADMSAGYLTFVTDFVSKTVLQVRRAVFSLSDTASTVQCSVRVQVQVVYCAACRTDCYSCCCGLACFVCFRNRNNKMKNGEIRKTEHIKVNIKVFRFLV